MFTRIQRTIARLRSDERGAMTFLQVVGFIIGPIVLAVVGVAAISVWRLGGDLGNMFSRDTQLTQMQERLQQQVTNITDIEVSGDTKFVVLDQPSRRTAYYSPSSSAPDVCVKNTWEFVNATGGTKTLVNTRVEYEGDVCEPKSGSVADYDAEHAKTWELSGFDADASFSFENAYGRDLSFDADGKEAGVDQSGNERPGDLFDNEWSFPEPGLVSVRGNLQQVIGSTPARATATTPMRQMRPGAVETDLGTLGPVVISRQHLEDDTYRNTFTAATELNDPRANVEWSYRWAYNAEGDSSVAGYDRKTAEPTNGEWSAWSNFSQLDYVDHDIHQGAKWQIQAQYRVKLGNEIAESEMSQVMTWIRPVETPAAPPAPRITLGAALTPAAADRMALDMPVYACPEETSGVARMRYSLDDEVNTGALTAWREFPKGTAANMTEDAPEGTKITALGGVKCVGAFAESAWSENSPNASSVQPVVTKPVMTGLDTKITGTKASIVGPMTSCPESTRYEVRLRWKESVSGWDKWAWSGWTAWLPTGAGVNYVLPGDFREGDGMLGAAEARCITDYAKGPAEAWQDTSIAPAPKPDGSAGDEGNNDGGPSVIRPITTRPTVTNPVLTLTAGNTPNVTAIVNGCPAGTSYQARVMRRTNAETDWARGTYTAAAAGLVTRSSSQVVQEGWRVAGGIDARCVTPFTNGPSGEATTGYTIRAVTAPAKPVVTLDANTTNGSSTSWGFTVSAPACAASAPLERQRRTQHGDAAWSAWTVYTAAVTGTANQGEKLSAQAQARCRGLYADSAWVLSDTKTAVKPIVKAPTVTNVSATIPSSTGYKPVVTGTLAACPAGTTYEARIMSRSNASTAWSYGTFEAAQAGSNSRTSASVRNEGDRFQGGLEARCVSPYAQGPAANGTAGYVVRPITSKPAVTNPKVTLTSTNTPHVTATVTACPAGTSLEARVMRKTNAETAWAYGGFSAAAAGTVARDSTQTIEQGWRVTGSISARCVSPYAQGAVTDGPAAAYVIRAVTAPAKPVVTLDANTTNGSSNQWGFSVNAPACAASAPLERQKRTALNAAAMSAWTAYTTAYSAAMNQGAQAKAQAQARCHGLYADSAWVVSDTKTGVKPIVGKPTIALTSKLNTAVLNATATLSACPTGTTYNGRWGSRLDEEASPTWKAYAAMSSGANTSNIRSDVYQGHRAAAYVAVRCVSPYATGPSVQTNNSWVIAPITSYKPTVTNPVLTLTSANHPHVTATIGGCPAGFTYDAAVMRKSDAETAWSYGAYTAASAGSVARDSTATVNQGKRVAGGIAAHCKTAYATGPVGSATTGYTIRPVTAPAKPVVTLTSNTTTGSSTQWGFTVNAPTCAAGTTLERQRRTAHNAGAMSAWTAYTATVTGSANQGEQLKAQAQARCAGTYASSGWVASDTKTAIKPIVTKPSVTGVTVTLSSTYSFKPVVKGNLAGCPAGTTYQAQLMSRKLPATTWSYGGFTPAVAGSNTRNSNTTVEQGNRYYGGLQARCVSPYTQGPSANGYNGGGATSPGTPADRPITSTPTIGTTTQVNSSTYGWGNLHSTTSLSGCPAGTTYELRWSVMLNASTEWRIGAWATGTAGSNSHDVTGFLEGYRGKKMVRVHCKTAYATGPDATKTATGGTGGYIVRSISDKVGLDTRNLVVDYPSSLSYKIRGQGWLGGDVCASHMTVEMNFSYGKNDAGWTNTTGWVTASMPGKVAKNAGDKIEYVSPTVLNQGEKEAMKVSLRCKTAYATGPGTDFLPPTQIRPITSTPSMTPSLTRSGANVTAHGSGFAGCPSGSTYQWTVTGSTWGTAASRAVGTVGAGSSVSKTFSVRCWTKYSTGPSQSYTRSISRPLDVPPAPSVSLANASGVCSNFGAGNTLTVTGISASGSGTVYIRGYFTDPQGRVLYTNWTTSRTIVMNPYKTGGHIQAYASNAGGSSAVVTAGGTWGGKTVC